MDYMNWSEINSKQNAAWGGVGIEKTHFDLQTLKEHGSVLLEGSYPFFPSKARLYAVHVISQSIFISLKLHLMIVIV